MENTNHNRFIGSNSPKERIVRGLKKAGIDNYFNEEIIISFDLVEKPKPEPDVYQKIMDVAILKKMKQLLLRIVLLEFKRGLLQESRLLV